MACAPTFAHYAQLCNPAQGLLIAETNLGVRQAALEHETPNVNFFTGSGLPPLRRWSDVAFLQYVEAAREAGGKVAMGRDIPEMIKGLRYVLRFRVQEPTTRTVVDWVLQQSGSKLVPWPGVTFGMDTEEGKAVLGTINGSGVAYLLAQRREALGRKTVEKVTVFGTEDTAVQPCPSLLFWIKDL
ncbi:hypothetical protein BS50DRAFT_568037 [Corynespora cassiicola Philippines]|uniref:Uncharacterized protein n=1 Tax=Corynespora cassiicola Philippines TaxID=1448308 RepID=A0A2T2PCH2_CORCC|nr:hypothetical protein BS50DRAFT_568037 [Corynespora cassiicola Philippines]